MRVMGHNVFAIIVAAVAFYAVEFVFFALLITREQYLQMTGLTASQGHLDRMAFGFLPPLLTALGLSLAIKWREAPGVWGGIGTALWMAVLFGFATSLYGWVYGSHDLSYLPFNLAHLLIAYAAAGAILGAWK